MKKKLLNRNNILFIIIPGICLIINFIILMYFQLRYGEVMLDSDMAGELILADVLNKEHSILSTNWIYSTELRVIQIQLLFKFGLFIFPTNFHLARCLAMAIAYFIYVGLVLLLFYILDNRKYAVWAAAIVLFPAGGNYFSQTLFGGMYCAYIFFSMATVILTFSVLKATKKYCVILWSVFLFAISFLSGLNGVKQLMCFFAPLLIASFILLISEIHEKEDSSLKKIIGLKSVKIFLLAFCETIFCTAGYLFNVNVLSKYYTFAQYDSLTLYEYDTFEHMLHSFITSFGFTTRQPVVSFYGLASFTGLLIGILVIVCAIFLLANLKKLSFEDRFISILGVSSIGFCVLIFPYIGGVARYFQPILPFSLFLIIYTIKNINFNTSWGRYSCAILFSLMMLFTSLGTINAELTQTPYHDCYTEPGIGKVVSWLEENEYYEGVSSYWTSLIITDLSDGKIEMWTSNEDGTPNEWMQHKDHILAYPSDRYFYLYKGSPDNSILQVFLQAHPYMNFSYYDGIYTIFTFN